MRVGRPACQGGRRYTFVGCRWWIGGGGASAELGAFVVEGAGSGLRRGGLALGRASVGLGGFEGRASTVACVAGSVGGRLGVGVVVHPTSAAVERMVSSRRGFVGGLVSVVNG